MNRADERGRSGDRQRGMIGRPAPKLSSFYGIGLGAVPIHLPLTDPAARAVSTGAVDSIINRGGAGSTFGTTATTTRRPTPAAVGVRFDGTDDALTLATAADLVGVHVLTRCKITNGTAIRIMQGSGGQVTLGPSSSNTSLRVQVYLGGTYVNSLPWIGPAWGVWHLIEMRFTGTQLIAWINGIRVIDQALTKPAPQSINTVGGAGSNGAFDLMDVISVVTGAATTDTEPAVIAARTYLQGIAT